MDILAFKSLLITQTSRPLTLRTWALTIMSSKPVTMKQGGKPFPETEGLDDMGAFQDSDEV